MKPNASPALSIKLIQTSSPRGSSKAKNNRELGKIDDALDIPVMEDIKEKSDELSGSNTLSENETSSITSRKKHTSRSPRKEGSRESRSIVNNQTLNKSDVMSTFTSTS